MRDPNIVIFDFPTGEFSAGPPAARPAPTASEAARIQRTLQAALSQERARRATTTARSREAFAKPIILPVKPTVAEQTQKATDAWFKRASDARQGTK
jgi:tRNA C32,U32 (ribose-2'-O)-methylase TrmJ